MAWRLPRLCARSFHCEHSTPAYGYQLHFFGSSLKSKLGTLPTFVWFLHRPTGLCGAGKPCVVRPAGFLFAGTEGYEGEHCSSSTFFSPFSLLLCQYSQRDALFSQRLGPCHILFRNISELDFVRKSTLTS
jgi:hypothetical protein